MKIYFACSITGGREYETVYQQIVDALLADGHQVPTELLVRSEVMALEKVVDPLEVYRRDTNWIQECDMLIAEVSTPSHGVGYEIGYALGLSKPVLCLYQRGVAVSKMILGNRDPRLVLEAYDTPDQAVELVRKRVFGQEG